jgi:serine/threonine protein kinase
MKAEYQLKEDISKEARELLQGILEKDPKKRLTVGEILLHPWFKDV